MQNNAVTIEVGAHISRNADLYSRMARSEELKSSLYSEIELMQGETATRLKKLNVYNDEIESLRSQLLSGDCLLDSEEVRSATACTHKI